MSDRFQEMNIFVRVAESGSLSATARELGVSQSSVSRAVADLEARLGAKLLLRTTRRIVPTEAGTAFLRRARQVLHDVEEADEAARGVDSASGVLRVAVSSSFAVRAVVPSLSAFLRAHPRLKVELLISDSRHDLVAEGVDLAIRFGRLKDSTFGARKLATLRRFLVASPAYLAARGTPSSPADLTTHDCLFGPGGSASQTWTFTHNGVASSVRVEARVQVTSAEALMACAREALGLTIATSWMCRAELKAGQLVPVLTDHVFDPIEVHAVFPAGPAPSQKVRLFTAHLAAVFDTL